ncbi:MAG: hypothetical protein H6719_06630 [Sandaracinaceae bacterium]|nr:hypothetical protein [Sandaracinaceae bacterium]
MRRLWWLCSLIVGCGGPAVVAPAPTPAAAPEVVVAEPPDTVEPPGLAIEVRVGEELTAPVEVEVTEQAGSAAWSARPGFTALRAEDARGPLEVVIDAGAVRFARAPAPPLTLRYQLRSPTEDDEHRGADPGRVYFDGGALLLPDEAAATSLVVAVHPGQPGVHGVASTLGVGEAHAFVARPEALRDVLWAVGRVDLVRFDTRDGVDVVASLGARRFDTRWVGAEIALLRSQVDTYFAAIEPGAFSTLIVSRPALGRVPPFTAARSGRGMRLIARDDAEWSSEARLPIAQVLVRRWLARAFVGPDGEDEAWVSLGVTRWIAQRTLTTMGPLTSSELALDLTMLEGALATAEPGERSPLTAMARGALYAAGLDARLRRRRELPRNLQHLLLPLLRVAQDEARPVRRAELVDALRAALGDEEVRRFEAQVLGDAVVEVPADAFGPCVRPRTIAHRRFALGFDAPPPQAEEITVGGVVEGGPAHRAGLRDGQRVRELRYLPGDPSVEVVAVLEGEPERTVRYLPFDRAARGRGWTRSPRLDEATCF